VVIPDLSKDAARGALSRLKAEAERRKRAQEQVQKATEHLREFIPLAWPIVEPDQPFIKAWHIDAMADHLQAMVDGHIRNLLVCVPPGSAKSMVSAVSSQHGSGSPGGAQRGDRHGLPTMETCQPEILSSAAAC